MSYAAAPATQSAAVRLTRRGRFLVTCLVLGVLVTALVLTAARSEATAEPGASVATRTVVVQAGDTLWDIAAEASGGGATQAAVLEIQRLNSLPSVSLSVGQRIQVPLS